MTEKELDNQYYGGGQGAMTPLSSEKTEYMTNLDSIIVSKVTQTLSGGMTMPAAEGADEVVMLPAGTPIVAFEDMLMPATSKSSLQTIDARPQNVIGVLVHSVKYGKGVNEQMSLAKAAHVNVDALCDALEECVKGTSMASDFNKADYKAAYIGGGWHNSLSLTFEQHIVATE